MNPNTKPIALILGIRPDVIRASLVFDGSVPWKRSI